MSTISKLDDLLPLYGEVSERAQLKELNRLDAHCRHFISLSPFLVIGTAAKDGPADCSPKGDAPGFVAVLDDNTIAIPDRIGNNRIDSLRNIVENPAVGIIFFLPGVNETLRINGNARISTDPDLLASLAAKGKDPVVAIVVDVAQAYMHCAKALIRSKLWAPETQIARADFPSLGKIIADQIGGRDVNEVEKQIEHGYKTRLY